MWRSYIERGWIIANVRLLLRISSDKMNSIDWYSMVCPKIPVSIGYPWRALSSSKYRIHSILWQRPPLTRGNTVFSLQCTNKSIGSLTVISFSNQCVSSSVWARASDFSIDRLVHMDSIQYIWTNMYHRGCEPFTIDPTMRLVELI